MSESPEREESIVIQDFLALKFRGGLVLRFVLFLAVVGFLAQLHLRCHKLRQVCKALEGGLFDIFDDGDDDNDEAASWP